MKRIPLLLLFLSLLFRVEAQIQLPIDRIEALVEAYEASDSSAQASVAELMALAESDYLKMDPLYVTQKQTLPPSGDKRDYMTLSPYWWPDPQSPNGLPYIRRDGERNPEVYNYPERENSGRLGEATLTLGLLYRVTGREIYAEKCASLIRAWFLDSEQGMHPNMRYAQLIPGRKTLRGTGIIDSRRFMSAVSAARLLEGSAAWCAADEAALRGWCNEFLTWLEQSEQGQKEMKAGNNHGLWYDAIRLMCMAYLKDQERMERVMTESLIPRLEVQISPEMTLPRELERTLSLHYTTFALEALTTASSLIGPASEQMWRYESSDGRSLVRLIEGLIPYYLKPESWPYRQINPFERDRAARLLDQVGNLLGREEWVALAAQIGCGGTSLESALYFDRQ